MQNSNWVSDGRYCGQRSIRAGLTLLLVALVLALGQVSRAEESLNAKRTDWPVPTWETRKKARTFLLAIPAPRGQIVDRNGTPLAQSKVVYNLAVSFPKSYGWTHEQVISHAESMLNLGGNLLGKSINVPREKIIEHYDNRGALPLVIVENLSETDLANVSRGIGAGLSVEHAYTRHYPLKEVACHVVGYVGRKAPLPTKPIENMDSLFPEEEGREGLELTFDSFLEGTPGVMNLTLDENGNISSERIETPPVPGNNVVTTIDASAQRLAEETLSSSGRRGAIVLIDPKNGDVIAMASNPGFDPNIFVPTINPEEYRKISEDPRAPLFCRAYKGSYPPGSTFKTFVGLGGLQTGLISPETRLSCPDGIKIGNIMFKNHESGAGELDLKGAMARSCNTWFYQLGLRLGGDAMGSMARLVGFGRKSGIPLRGENIGSIPDADSILRQHGRIMSGGDAANISIGQGDVQVSPLQMTQAMGILAGDGGFRQTRLVKQVQAIDNTVIAAYPPRLMRGVGLSSDNVKAIQESLVAVTRGAGGTGHRAVWSSKIKVAGKTGTAQRKVDGQKQNVAWFAGFAPADDPRYAFAVAVEGVAGEEVSGGKTAAPLARKVLSSLLKDYKAPEKKTSLNKDGETGEIAQEAEASDGNMLETVAGKIEELMVGTGGDGQPADAEENSQPIARVVAETDGGAFLEENLAEGGAILGEATQDPVEAAVELVDD
jgi:penicillin-binding protein 2